MKKASPQAGNRAGLRIAPNSGGIAEVIGGTETAVESGGGTSRFFGFRLNGMMQVSPSVLTKEMVRVGQTHIETYRCYRLCVVDGFIRWFENSVRLRGMRG